MMTMHMLAFMSAMAAAVTMAATVSLRGQGSRQSGNGHE
jgi:hypothetical protein